MKKIIYIILLILILGAGGFFIYSKNKNKDNNQPTREYGILNPNPGQNVAPTTSSPDENKPTESKPTPAPASHPATTPTTGTKTPTSTTTKPTTAKPTTSVATNNGTSTYTISGLNLEITVPDSLKPRLEEASGNVVAFYNSNGSAFGQIEVLVDAQESFQALTNEIMANPNVSGVQQTTVNGYQALSFNDQRYGGGKVIALVHGNNVYYFRGGFAQATYYQNIRFIN